MLNAPPSPLHCLLNPLVMLLPTLLPLPSKPRHLQGCSKTAAVLTVASTLVFVAFSYATPIVSNAACLIGAIQLPADLWSMIFSSSARGTVCLGLGPLAASLPVESMREQLRS